MADLETIVDGVDFGEGPRWRDDLLWYSDFYQHRVYTVNTAGKRECVLELDDQPSGLGWLPDGSLLVVSMTERQLIRYDGETTSTFADLSGVAAFHCNDMVVSDTGHAYVGNLGFDVVTLGLDGLKPAKLAHVTPDGHVTIGAEDLLFPNGSVITPDGGTLIVGETIGGRYTAFDIGDDGQLSEGRIWADFEDHNPDGCALDAAGGIWFADPAHSRVARTEQGGTITDTIDLEVPAWACMLGGPDGRTLFLLTAPDFRPAGVEGKALGSILATTVQHPHAGLP